MWKTIRDAIENRINPVVAILPNGSPYTLQDSTGRIMGYTVRNRSGGISVRRKDIDASAVYKTSGGLTLIAYEADLRYL
jgi:hypothetical protein